MPPERDPFFILDLPGFRDLAYVKRQKAKNHPGRWFSPGLRPCALT